MVFCKTVIRPSGEHYWLMNHKDKGFASNGYADKNLEKLLKDFNIKIIGEGEDKFGPYYEVDNDDRKSEH